MLLITCNEWMGPSRECLHDPPKSKERMVCFATNLPLAVALARIQEYTKAYAARFGPRMTVEFRLISVSEASMAIGPSILAEFGVEIVEELSVE